MYGNWSLYKGVEVYVFIVKLYRIYKNYRHKCSLNIGTKNAAPFDFFEFRLPLKINLVAQRLGQLSDPIHFKKQHLHLSPNYCINNRNENSLKNYYIDIDWPKNNLAQQKDRFREEIQLKKVQHDLQGFVQAWLSKISLLQIYKSDCHQHKCQKRQVIASILYFLIN